ncbi:polysaccharide pyruvyl transferase family protein [Candidatus Saccharibacteria bacterium]|nr:polysaccharide pyruvyl transferase family protein [Candidatus Saccharibacteria bacterium]
MIIDVITRHIPSNYGSLLRSIASIKVLERMGHDVSIIDYVRPDDLGLKKVWTEARLKGGSIAKKMVYVFIRYPIEKIAELRFNRMRKKYLKTTSRYRSLDGLSALKADVFMTGSDQVWGPMVSGKYDLAYFLSFVESGKKVAYAASFGKSVLDQCAEEMCKQMLASYDKITIRENSALLFIEKWGLKKCYGQVLDPSLLLSSGEWKEMFGIKDELKDPYILVYQIHNDKSLSEYAKNLANYKKLKLIRVSPFLHQCIRGGNFHLCPDVKGFLTLINNATYIVTDSFHGTCFSVNFNKQFVEILPNNATGTRNQSILTLVGLSSRIILDYSDFSIVDRMIDYDSVNKILKTERARCLQVMSSLLD